MRHISTLAVTPVGAFYIRQLVPRQVLDLGRTVKLISIFLWVDQEQISVQFEYLREASRTAWLVSPGVHGRAGVELVDLFLSTPKV